MSRVVALFLGLLLGLWVAWGVYIEANAVQHFWGYRLTCITAVMVALVVLANVKDNECK